jgi:hypothetical protein
MGRLRHTIVTTYRRGLLTHLGTITALLLNTTLYISPQHPLSLFQSAVSSPAVPWHRNLTAKILQLSALRFSYHSRPCRTLAIPPIMAPSLLNLPCRAQISTANPQLSTLLSYDWWFTASHFVLASSRLSLTTETFFQLNPCCHSPHLTSSLTRRWVNSSQLSWDSRHIASGRTQQKNTAFNSSAIVVGVFTEPLPRNGPLFIRRLHINGCSRLLRGLYLATALYATL